MGIQIAIEDERGGKIESIEDSQNILHRILPARDNKAYQWLNTIDWYGDTTFNRYQIPNVRRELTQVAMGGLSSEALQFIRQIDALAARAESEPHLYLKLYGD